jgi:alpha-D-ribose 1-methylphosphonate 5-triphosphate synthase subunit PhnH
LSGVAFSSIQPGFPDSVAGSQAVFRLAMNAMARPGRCLAMAPGLTPPRPLGAASAALLLTLCDFETTVWLDPPLAGAAGVSEYVRFHTGARLVASPAEAAWAVVSDTARMPPLAGFAQGTPDYPDRSATLILQVGALSAGGWRLEGPGILGHAQLSARPLPGDFIEQMRANRRHFPCGVDIFFTDGRKIAALPRSTRLTEAP